MTYTLRFGRGGKENSLSQELDFGGEPGGGCSYLGVSHDTYTFMKFNTLEDYMDKRTPFTGINEYCKDCDKECKQFCNTRVVRCGKVLNIREDLNPRTK